MRKTKFQINEDKVFEGYSFNQYWNGWDQPCFTKKTAQEVLDYYLNQECKESAAGWRECFQEILDSEDKIIFSKLTEVSFIYKGENVTAYDFGFGYCWHEVENNEKEVVLSLTRKASHSLYQALDVFVMKNLDSAWSNDEKDLYEIFNTLKEEVK